MSEQQQQEELEDEYEEVVSSICWPHSAAGGGRAQPLDAEVQ